MARSPGRARPARDVLRGLLALLLLAGAPRADVIVVDALGLGDATALQPAIDLAGDGDLILIRPGVYATPADAAVVLDKSLTIVADVGGPVLVPPLAVVGLAPGKAVVLRGLDIVDLPGHVGPALNLLGCAGVVFVEDCELRGQDAPTDLASSGVPGSPGVLVTDSTGVSLHRCTVAGGHGADQTGLPGTVDQPSAGGAGMHAERSTVAVYHSTVTGGDPGSGPLPIPPGGGSGSGTEGVGGIEVVLDFIGTTVVGGSGSDGCFVGQELPCLGGPAMSLDAASLLRTIDTTLLPGPGGELGGGGVAPPGPVLAGAGQTIAYEGGSFVQAIDAPLRTGQPGLFVLSGEPNALFGVFVSIVPEHLPIEGSGVFVLSVGPQLLGPLVLAWIPPTGTFQAPFTTPLLAAVVGFENLTVQVQTFAQDAAGRLLLTNGTSFIILGSQF